MPQTTPWTEVGLSTMKAFDKPAMCALAYQKPSMKSLTKRTNGVGETGKNGYYWWHKYHCSTADRIPPKTILSASATVGANTKNRVKSIA